MAAAAAAEKKHVLFLCTNHDQTAEIAHQTQIPISIPICVLLSGTNTHFNLLFHVYMRLAWSISLSVSVSVSRSLARFLSARMQPQAKKRRLPYCIHMVLLIATASCPIHVYGAYLDLRIYAYFITHFKRLATIASKTRHPHIRLPLKMANFL